MMYTSHYMQWYRYNTVINEHSLHFMSKGQIGIINPILKNSLNIIIRFSLLFYTNTKQRRLVLICTCIGQILIPCTQYYGSIGFIFKTNILETTDVLVGQIAKISSPNLNKIKVQIIFLINLHKQNTSILFNWLFHLSVCDQSFRPVYFFKSFLNVTIAFH